MKKKIMTIFGTRPEAIKMAPLVKELEKSNNYECIVAVTAQHREMLDQVLKLFDITPQYDLDIMQPGQTLSGITTRSLLGLEEVLKEAKPDLILVHGDTSTTFVGSLAAFYQQIPVGHVEAGLRSGEKYSPYPEEMNRRLTGTIADIHFAPTATSRENLLKENIDDNSIYVTGNTVIDALFHTVKDDYVFQDELLNNLNPNKKILLVTTHRRENLGEPMRQVYLALRQIIEEFSDVQMIFPVHKNPAVRKVVEEVLGGLDNVFLIEPLDYEPFVNVMNKAFLVLTDSGGLQEEAPSLGKPVLVLRDNTERPEAISAGTVSLIGTERNKVYHATKELITLEKKYYTMARAVNPYGDGKACERIILSLDHYFGINVDRPSNFGL